MFNVSQFRSQMKLDGARANLFEVRMNFPSFANAGNSSEQMKFMCKTAQIPGSTVGVAPVFYQGRELKFPGNRTFADWTVTILNDEDFLVRNAFERWMNGLNAHRSGNRTASGLNPSSYAVDALVTHLGKKGNPIREYKFVGMFPNDLAPIDLDWGNNDAIEEYSVTLAYQWWEVTSSGII